MPKVYPKDTPQKRNERKSFKIIFTLLDSDCWEYIGSDQNDHGVDYTFEYIEDEKYKGYRILCQVKCRTNPEIRKNSVVFDFPVKTASYALGCSQPFLFFFVNLSTCEALYLPLQDYFMANPDKMKALDDNISTVRVFIPLNNRLGDLEFVQVVKSQYTFDEERGLRKTR